MSLYDWIYSIYPSDSGIDGRWGTLHIIVIILCVLAIVGISFLRGKSEKVRKIVIFICAGLIATFEIMRRVINLSRGINGDIGLLMRILLPRPYCAISCWLVVISVFVNKKFLYNITSICSLLCAIIFFAYPSVGFNDKYILFENVYSIGTHSLLLITSISLITLKFTDFKYYSASVRNSVIKELICMAIIYVYGFIEIFVIKIEKDPLYFMPDGEVQAFLGVEYSMYLVIYIVFLIVWFNSFYLIQLIISKLREKK